MLPQSANFGFLSVHDPQLVRLGALAERYFKDDPSTCLIKLRQFGEVLAQITAVEAGLFGSPDEKQADLLRRLKLAERRRLLLDRLDQATLAKAFCGELFETPSKPVELKQP